MPQYGEKLIALVQFDSHGDDTDEAFKPHIRAALEKGDFIVPTPNEFDIGRWRDTIMEMELSRDFADKFIDFVNPQISRAAHPLETYRILQCLREEIDELKQRVKSD